MKMTVGKNIAMLLSGTALAAASTQAGAVSVTSAAETFNPAHTITNAAGTNPIGTSLDNPGGHIITAGASQSAVYHDYTTVKSWADLAIDLGWMHSTDWVQVNIADSGQYRIKDEIIGLRNVAGSADTATYTYSPMVQDKSIHPAFSLWSLSGNTFASTGSTQNTQNSFVAPHPTTGVDTTYNYGSATAPTATHYTGAASYGSNPPAQYNSNMGFNQVAAPTPTNNGRFLLSGGVNGIVGYSNSGVSFVNGDGDAVGSGSPGASSGTNADGFTWTDLVVNLAAGSYLMAVGGSCVDLVNCGPYQIRTTIATGATTTVYGTGWHELTVSAVPVPAAVWLLASALGGMGVFGRRRKAA